MATLLLAVGLVLGMRGGVALPTGNVGTPAAGDNHGLSEELSFSVPVLLEAGYRFGAVTAGGYLQYAWGSVAGHAPLATDQCSQPGVTCSNGHSIRLGVQAIWTFRRDTSSRPWLGIGAGYEWAGYDAASTAVSYRGWEWANLQFGWEFDVAPGFTLGPVLSGSIAQYANAQIGDQAGEIARKSIHGWNFIGLRGTFEL